MQLKSLRIVISLLTLFSILAAYTIVGAQSTISATLHYVEATPDAQQTAYDVKAYVSVLDVNENPIIDLTTANFSVSEDSQAHEITSSELATNEPINIILVIDTSPSMKDQKIKDALAAASAFIERLRSQDKVAILTFNTTFETKIDFTSDFAAAQDQMRLIETVPFSSTCLYDALYQAIVMMTTVPTGRRSIVLLTDGVDETPQKTVCSKSTIDDVINLASGSTSRVPIYPIGLGNRIDEPGLIRLAKETGGRYLYSPKSDQLDAQFGRLTEQLSSQYVLRYHSMSSIGDHNVTVRVSYLEHQAFTSTGLFLPGLPLHLTFVTPTDGTTITSPEVKLLVVATGAPSSGETVTGVTFKLGDRVLQAVNTVPYELDLNTSALPIGGAQLIAVAIGENGQELAQTAITVYVPPPPTATILPTPVLATATPPATTWGYGQLGFGCLGVILLAVFVFSFLSYFRNRSRAEKIGKATDKLQLTYDDHWEEDKSALAVLTVINCDDFNAGYQKFNVLKPQVTLGRNPNNDIAFPNEKPVSRHHAEIFEKNGDLYIKEIYSEDESNVVAPPKYGTFVNETKVGENGLRLRSNDRIRLGKRLTLLIDIPMRPTPGIASESDGTTEVEAQRPAELETDQINETELDPDQTDAALSEPGRTHEQEIDDDQTNDVSTDPDRTNS